MKYRDFWPYGEEATPPAGSERMKFTGHERDLGNLTSSADDVDYMHARYYRPVWRRFVGPDQAMGRLKAPQSWNRYSYEAGNPIKYVDPLGDVYVLSGCASGNAKECSQQMALLQAALGASYSSISVGKDGTVSLKVSPAAFSSRGTFEKAMAALIGSQYKFTLFTGANSYTRQSGGAATKPLHGGGANIYVDPHAFPKATGDVTGTAATALVHETGHALGTIFPDLYRRLNDSLGITMFTRYMQPEGYAVNFENRYRKEHYLELRSSYFGLAQDVLYDPDTNLVPWRP